MAGTPQLDGQVAIVTGGSRGIGLATARALLAQGAKVAIGASTDDSLREAEADLNAGDRLLTIRGSVADEADATRLVAQTAERFGGVDILINNAGVGEFANVADLSTDQWTRVIGINLTGVFFCSRAAIPHMRTRGGGWIINVSSLAGQNPFAGGAAYSATKAGLDAFTHALMLEVRQENIRVSLIAPGSVNTHFSGSPGSHADWKLSADDVAEVVTDLLAHPARSLPSRVDLRPSRPPKK
jgi:NAD(P)-dependent dehydrogenase (short-subunit alcohol dehydrogenase family)